jgi:diguanylate cyclase (GGDEF)-like protein
VGAAAEARYQAEKEYRRTMQAQQRRLAASQAAGQVGTWEVDLATGETTLSPEYLRLHGEDAREPDRPYEEWLADVHPDDRDVMRSALDRREEYAQEYRWIRDPDDVRIFVEHGAWIPGEDGHPGYLVGTAHDITDVRRKEEELRHLADHEPLTRLLNRGAFERAYERFIDSGRDPERGPGAVFLLDLDRFKHHNDTYGHQRGDEILSVVADALRGRLRDGDDVAARWGGDEFIALVPRLTTEQAENVAADLVRRVAERTAAASPDASNPVTVSLGVVLLDDQPDVLTAVHRADKALYVAKNAGRNQWSRWVRD